MTPAPMSHQPSESDPGFEYLAVTRPPSSSGSAALPKSWWPRLGSLFACVVEAPKESKRHRRQQLKIPPSVCCSVVLVCGAT